MTSQRIEGTAIKALRGTTSPVHGFEWSLPTQAADGSWIPGRWAAVKGKVQYRANGLHVCSDLELPYWVGHIKASDLTVWE